MLHRQAPEKRPPLREAMRRLDRVAGDLNVFLLVLALGLATLDFTFFVTEKIVDGLPPITHIDYSAPTQPAK